MPLAASADVLGSSADEDEDQNEKGGGAALGRWRRYTQREKHLMRDIHDKELARGIVINFRSPRTWDPFSYRVSTSKPQQG